MRLFFAPLQGYTDYIYRRVHCESVGGITAYFTPFLRWEKGGLRNKDLRDILPENNEGVPVVVQVIAANHDEFCYLCDAVESLGWKHIDFNMGCPFPLQTRMGRGCGIMSYPDRVSAIVEEMGRRSEVSFSVKMRLGEATSEEGLSLLPLLNDSPVRWITLHPRLGVQQYKGRPDMEAFEKFLSSCDKPMVYNGDVACVSDLERISASFPNLYGVMMGRGLLANPFLGREFVSPDKPVDALSAVWQMHDALFMEISGLYQGDGQILSRMRAFWEYMAPHFPRKYFKAVIKSGNVKNYLLACSLLRKEDIYK